MTTLPGRDRHADMLTLADAFFEALERDECEYGGWGIDSKRPFGNSDVEGDVLFMLGIEPHTDRYGEQTFHAHEAQYVRSLYDDLGDFLRRQWAEFRKVQP